MVIPSRALPNPLCQRSALPRALLLATVALTSACASADDRAEDDSGDSEDALSARPPLSLTRQGLVGSYFEPGGCLRFSAFELLADGSYKTKGCASAWVTPTVETGTWSASSRKLTLSPSAGGTPTTYQLKRAAEFREEPALAAVSFTRAGATFRLAKKMPPDAVLGNLTAGDAREFRYEEGKREGPTSRSLSAVTVDVAPGQRVTLRVEADAPLYVGSFPPGPGGELPAWRTSYPTAPEYVVFYRSRPGASALYASSVQIVHLAPTAGKHVVVFGATSDPMGDGGVHVRIASGDGAAAPPSIAGTGGTLPVTISTWESRTRTYNQSAEVSLGEGAGGKILLNVKDALCLKGRDPLTFTLEPDREGGLSGLHPYTGRGFAYASIRTVGGRLTVHVETFDNFVQGSPHPYLNATTCRKTLQGSFTN